MAILQVAERKNRLDESCRLRYDELWILSNTRTGVVELVGHPVGGVCPFGCKEGIPVYLDVSLQRFETVFPAVGSPSSAIELNLDELYKYSNALEWVDVCKLPAPAEA